MKRQEPYQYLPYDPKDETYFGCGKVVHAEWDYIYKRRASQAAAETEQDNGDTRIVDLVIPENDGHGGLWMRVFRVLTQVKHKNHVQPQPENESKHAKQPPPPDQSGIALSGGGIRSASFCLGVLQALAYAGWFKKLDYMSTVSGGGYIGGSISWLLHRKWTDDHGKVIPYGLDRKNFPYGSYPMMGMEDKREEGKAAGWDVYKGRMLRHLRQHARYLTPGDGINIMSLLAVVLRNTLFSLFVYGGLLVVLFALAWPFLFYPVMGAWGLESIRSHLVWFPTEANRALGMAIALALGLLFAAIVYVILTSLLPKEMSTGYRLRYFYERWMGRMLTLAIILIAIGCVPVVHCWLEEAGHNKAETSTLKFSSQGVALGEVTFAGKLKQSEGHPLAEGELKVTTQNSKTGNVSVNGNITTVGDEKSAQKSDWSLPIFKNNMVAFVGGISTLLGAISSIWAFVQEGRKKKRIPTSIFVAIASFGLIFGVLLLTYHFAALLRAEAIASGPLEYTLAFPTDMLRGLGVWGGVGILLFFFLRIPNLNYHSLHRYYRDRLMETFTPDLPDAIHVNGPVPGASKSADYIHLYNILNEQGGAGELGPYHIINANIVLVSSDIPKFRGRGGDNFILTPRYCGSNATGWCETRRSPYEDMTLPTAIAISGAAVNSNTGSGGDGMTRSPWLSFLMGFFNIRLGYWANNPTPRKERLRRIAKELARPLKVLPERNEEKALPYTLRITWHGLFVVCRWPLNQLKMLFHGILSLPLCAGRNTPNAFYPGLFEMYLRKNLDENSRMVQLSDGGHFENLGLYELIRRRLKLIIVCDGSADPNYGFEDLANAMEKVRADFGAIINLHCPDMETLTPKSVIETGDETGKRVTYAEQGYLMATITYNDRTEGTLLFLTTTFFKELSSDLYAYRKAHDEFPDQSTSDQFFDEKQFEAYRELGFQTAHRMMGDDEIVANADVQRILGQPHMGPSDEGQ